MSPDRITGLSQQDRENLRSTASWLNAELEGGACFWREDITSAIRQFPNPILIDLDGTLVEQGNREKINPQAQEVLQRAERVGSVFIVTSGLVTIDGLKRLGLASDRTVLIARQNYPSPFEDLPPYALEQVGQYCAMREKQGVYFRKNVFDLESPRKKHMAPLFMQPYPIPLIDNSVYPIYLNPGIYGITARSWPYSQVQRSYRFLPDYPISFQYLSDAAVAVEDFYALDPSARQLRTESQSYIVGLKKYQKGQLEPPMTLAEKYTHIALGIEDLFKNIGMGLLTEITGQSTTKYYLQLSIQPAVLDGPIRQLEFRTAQESFVFSLANSPITQGLSHGFNWLTYARYAEGRLVWYGNFNQQEAGAMTQREHPHLQVVDVFQKFERLLDDILP